MSKKEQDKPVVQTDPVNITVTGMADERNRITQEIKTDVLKKLAAMGIERADKNMMENIMQGVFAQVLIDFAEFGVETGENGMFSATMMSGKENPSDGESSVRGACVGILVYGPNAIEIANKVGAAMNAERALIAGHGEGENGSDKESATLQ